MENSKFGEIGCSLRNTCSEGRAILGYQGPCKRTGATYVPPEYQQDPLTSRFRNRVPFLVSLTYYDLAGRASVSLLRSLGSIV